MNRRSVCSVMRVIALLSALVLASLPRFAPALAPTIYLRSVSCAAAQGNASAIGAALGFSHAHVTCLRSPVAALYGPVPPKLKPVPGLIAYSGNEHNQSGAPRVGQTVQIPSDVPFVAATGSIVGYVKVSTLLLSLDTDDAVSLAFALEDVGVRRDDIVTSKFKGATFVVRVRPVSAAAVRKIIAVVNAQQIGPLRTRPVYWTAGFLNDCDSVIADLGGLAVARAADHARTMARAAKSRLREVLRVVDSGDNIPDAICGVPKDASTTAYVKAAIDAFEMTGVRALSTPQLYATIMRSVSVAWRLDLPRNGPGSQWQRLPEFQFISRTREKPAFISDGLRVEGNALLPNTVEPNRIRIYPPAWTLDKLRKSPFSHEVTDLEFGIPPVRPQIDIRARTSAELKEKLDGVLAYLRKIPVPKGASLDLSFLYSRGDCSSAVDEALYHATLDAVAKAHGHIRYLEEYYAEVSAPVICTYELGPYDVTTPPTAAIPTSGTVAGVYVGYDAP